MDNFEHIPVNDLWSDFTKATEMEEAISTTEIKIREIVQNEKYSTIGNFSIHGKLYDIRYIPSNFTNKNMAIDEFRDPKFAPDALRYIFGISGAFFYITAKNNITTQEARTILSVISPAVSACGTNLPMFVCIQKEEYMTFLGFSVQGKIHTHMSSYTDWRADTPFTSFQPIKEIFINSVPAKINKISTTLKRYYLVEKDKFDKKLYRESTFYSRIKQDPIHSVEFILQSKPLINIEKEPEIDSSNDIAIIATLTKKNVEESRMSKFIDFIIHTSQMDRFYPTSADDAASQKIEKLFKRASQPAEKSKLKAAPKDSLLTDLVVTLTFADSLMEACSLWYTFLKKVRNYFDHSILIPGVDSKGPDFDNCLIYQKLEMINFCINVKDSKNREFTKAEDTGKKLLNGNPMIAPSTQTITTRTEDQIIESEELLLKNYEDQRQKSMLQSRQLRSDIAAFKAANEGCVFEDFVRWYSPADYDESQNKLSQRMSEDGNVWHEMWNNEVAKKAEDQEPIFDAMNEGELALDYLESLIPTEVFGDLVPVLLSASYFDIKSKLQKKVPSNLKYFEEVERALNEFHNEVELANDKLSIIQYIKISAEKVHIIERAAYEIAIVNSLLLKFPGCFFIIQNLLNNGITIPSNDKEKEKTLELMKALNISDKSFRQRTDFILTGETNEGTHRLYAAEYIDRLGFPNHVVVASSLQEIL